MEADRNAAGIFQSKTNMEANTKYQYFRGKLIDELSEQAAKGTPVTRGSAKEKEIVNGLLKEVTSKDPGLWATMFGGETKRTYQVTTENKPPYVERNYPDAVYDPNGAGSGSGAWHVWRDGKKMNIKIPTEGK